MGKASDTRAESRSDAASNEGYRVVQRTIMRADQELDVRALYMGAITSMASSGDAPSRQSGSDRRSDDERRSDSTSTTSDSGMIGYGRVNDDDSTVAEPGRRITFGTYFNAFPASYWRRWSEHRMVRLVARLRGEGTLIVYRSTARGHVLRTDAIQVRGDSPTTRTLDLTLEPFIDGGWYWFDLEAGSVELVLESAEWMIESDRLESGTVTIGITTFNRPDFCADQLVALSKDPSTLAILDEVIVVDQGNQKVVDTEKYTQAKEVLGDRLRIIDQPNLGGSGGFSRAMFETVQRGASDYVLLLDDDVVCELEGIKRAVAFSDLATRPTIVGGHMFSLYDRTVMHAYGEALSKWTWFWGPAPHTKHSHDWARRPLRSTPWLHRRVDVDYTGWWMCLIPTSVVREIGMSLPMFIKWDDAEFGLRAGKAGFPTATLPGAAVWHVPWTEKDDTLDWQAYFHERNRLISALLHSPYEHGGRMVGESMKNHTARLMSMQYGTADLIMLALEDVLAGPERMHHDMATRLPLLRSMVKDYVDGQSEQSLDAFPRPRMKRPPRKGKGVPNPQNFPGKLAMALTGLARQVRAPRELSSEAPEGIVPHVDQRWFRLAHYDSAIVTAADGTSAAWYRRDRAQFMREMRRSSELHARLYREWPELSRRYKDALDQLASPGVWKATFDGLDD